MIDAIEEFSRLAQLEMPVIYRFMLASLRDKDLAETLTQECFLKAYRNRSSFRRESSARTWLMRIAINLQKDHWRDRRMRFWRETQTNAVDVESAIELLPSTERSPEARILAREQVMRIWELVGCLSRRERSVFLLRYVEETRTPGDRAVHRIEGGGGEGLPQAGPGEDSRRIGRGR